jgi:hypothetical protein
LFKDNKQEYERRVKVTVEQSWMDDEDLHKEAEQELDSLMPVSAPA